MDPAATLRLRGLGELRSGRDLGEVDSKLQMKMGEGVLDEARHLAPLGSERRMIQLKLLPRPSVQGKDGVSSMPPSRPFKGRSRSSTAPSSRSATKAWPRRVGRSAFSSR